MSNSRIVRMGQVAAFALWTLGVASSHLSAQTPAPARAQAPAPAPEPAQLGVLAPANLAKSRPKAPFDLTGTWLHNTPGGTERFDPPQGFKLTPEAQVHYDAGQKATAAGKVYRSDISLCWPAGMPIMMTRVWPVSMIQLPTSIFMISLRNTRQAVATSRTQSSKLLRPLLRSPARTSGSKSRCVILKPRWARCRPQGR